MSSSLNVEKTVFDLDIFHQILVAMDGYAVLPDHASDEVGLEPLDPWDLPGMPNISPDTWRYHVGFAIDRGFVQCWTPLQVTRHRNDVRSSGSLKGTSRGGRATMSYSEDPNVSSELRPARLTYSGKEFIDNLNNQSVKVRAVDALRTWGLPVAMQVVSEAAKHLLGAEVPSTSNANQTSA